MTTANAPIVKRRRVIRVSHFLTRQITIRAADSLRPLACYCSRRNCRALARRVAHDRGLQVLHDEERTDRHEISTRIFAVRRFRAVLVEFMLSDSCSGSELNPRYSWLT